MPNAKLTAEKVINIRMRYAAGEHPKVLSREFAIGLRSVWHVIQRQSWGWVCLPGEQPMQSGARKIRRGYAKHHRTYEKS